MRKRQVAGYPKDVLRTAVIVPSQEAVLIDLPDHVNLVFEDRRSHAHETYAGRKCGIIVETRRGSGCYGKGSTMVGPLFQGNTT